MIIFQPKALFALVKRTLSGFSGDNAASMGAALAFYSLLSMAPLLVIVIAIAGIVIGQDQARDLLLTQLTGLLGDTGAQGVSEMLNAASRQKDGIIQASVGVVALLFGATTVLAELQDDLDRIWKCEAPKSSGAWGWLRRRFITFGLIVVLGFLLLVSLVVSAAVSYMGAAWFGGSEAMGHVLEFVGSIIVMSGLFALTFKILPSRRIPWGDVLLGSVITAFLFEIGKFLIGLYLGKSAVASNFGAAGTVVVAILWVYYSAQIFFFGAELTRAYSTSHGSKRMERAANSDFTEENMVKRAERIVRGNDPDLTRKPS